MINNTILYMANVRRDIQKDSNINETVRDNINKIKTQFKKMDREILGEDVTLFAFKYIDSLIIVGLLSSENDILGIIKRGNSEGWKVIIIIDAIEDVSKETLQEWSDYDIIFLTTDDYMKGSERYV